MSPLARRPPGIVSVLALIATLVALLFARPAQADGQGRPACPDAATAWAAQCGAAEGFSVQPIVCGPRLATFRVESSGMAYKIEIRPDQPGFRGAGRFGVSPIGEYPDWKATPQPMQDALDKLVRCAERGVSGDVFAGEVTTGEAMPVGAASPVPWRILGAGVAVLIAAIALLRRARLRAWPATALGLVALAAGAFALRRALHPAAFFHQNGHGAAWIGCALGSGCEYGPGYRELFGFAAGLDPAAAERPVFVASALLAATAPASIWLIVRGAGAPRVIAWAAAVVAVLEPGLGRLAQSESYYGVTAWLLLAAAAALASGARPGRLTSLPFVASVLGAGLLVAEAALVHPVCWVPAALVPFAASVGRGAMVRRIKLGVASAIGVGLVVAASAGPTMLGVYRAESRWGAQFGAVARSRIQRLEAPALVVAAVIAALCVLVQLDASRRPARRALRIGGRLAAVGAALATATVLDQISDISPWLGRGWWALFLPALVAGGAGVLAVARAHRWLARASAAAILIAGIAFSARHRRALAALPTDALEASWVSGKGGWRDALPPGARVAYVERAGLHVLTLPIYAERDPRKLRIFAFNTEEAEYGRILDTSPGSFYYRASTCSTPEGQSFCTSLESGLDLEPVSVTTLPALPSMPGLGFDREEVFVGLFRIRGVR